MCCLESWQPLTVLDGDWSWSGIVLVSTRMGNHKEILNYSLDWEGEIESQHKEAESHFGIVVKKNHTDAPRMSLGVELDLKKTFRCCKTFRYFGLCILIELLRLGIQNVWRELQSARVREDWTILAVIISITIMYNYTGTLYRAL